MGYYRGVFETKMTKQEAALTLGISSTVNKEKIRDVHQQIILLNDPKEDLSMQQPKINDAKELLKGQAENKKYT